MGIKFGWYDDKGRLCYRRLEIYLPYNLSRCEAVKMMTNDGRADPIWRNIQKLVSGNMVVSSITLH